MICPENSPGVELVLLHIRKGIHFTGVRFEGPVTIIVLQLRIFRIIKNNHSITEIIKYLSDIQCCHALGNPNAG